MGLLARLVAVVVAVVLAQRQLVLTVPLVLMSLDLSAGQRCSNAVVAVAASRLGLPVLAVRQLVALERVAPIMGRLLLLTQHLAAVVAVPTRQTVVLVVRVLFM
jgi:hypothetical protein